MPVWPFLLAACAIASYWNWRAALSYAVCIILVRAILYFGLNNPQLLIMVTYIVALFAVLFFVDTIAGGFLGIVALLYGAFLLGVIGHRGAMIWSEAAMVVGLLVSALVGPSGGQYSGSDRSSHGVGRDSSDVVVGSKSLPVGSEAG